MSGWPALRAQRPWSARLDVEEAVWGKVHRQASDFRCIAATPGFESSALGPALGAGAEDRPTRCVFWRRLDDGRAAAVAAYPSRAVDAAGRSGFLERRVFLWRPEPGVSILAGLLALLPEVEKLAQDHDLARNPGDWLQPDFRLPLEPRILEVSEAEIARRTEQGLERLVGALDESALAAFYAKLLAGRRPVVLPSPKPFGAEMLAALLLPLPASEAGALSLAGWIPSSRASSRVLAENWQVVVGELAGPAVEPPVGAVESGRKMARALVDDEPDLLESDRPPSSSSASSVDLATDAGPSGAGPSYAGPVEELPREPGDRGRREDFTFEPPEGAASSAGEPAWLASIRAFVEDPGARWLDPERLALDLPLDERVAPQLETWRRAVESSMPEEADAWQWAVKVDLLAALLVAVAPAAPEADRLTFQSGRVPALLFVQYYDQERLEAWRRQCPGDCFNQWRRQSVEIRSAATRGRV